MTYNYTSESVDWNNGLLKTTYYVQHPNNANHIICSLTFIDLDNGLIELITYTNHIEDNHQFTDIYHQIIYDNYRTYTEVNFNENIRKEIVFIFESINKDYLTYDPIGGKYGTLIS